MTKNSEATALKADTALGKSELTGLVMLPCPFCGKQVTKDDLEDALYPSGVTWRESEFGRVYGGNHTHPNQCYQFVCQSHKDGCGATMDGDSKEDVVSKWNGRRSLLTYQQAKAAVADFEKEYIGQNQERLCVSFVNMILNNAT